ncbi:MAG: cryptochrome/photolyase family protein [Pseudomonadota bacterium]
MSVAIWWIRRDLRLEDNPALWAACEHESLIPLYIHAPEEELEAGPGAASRWWLHHSLEALRQDLGAQGLRLVLRKGAHAQAVLDAVLEESGAEAVYWNRQYAPAQLARDASIKTALRSRGLRAESFNSALLFEPWQMSRQNQPYKVFTPFWKACLAQGVDQGVSALPRVWPKDCAHISSEALESFGLLPATGWDQGFNTCWSPGAVGAWRALTAFVKERLPGYAHDRDRPGISGSSRLSPHLHFGEIGPRQIVNNVLASLAGDVHEGAQAYFRELGWREFAHHQLYHFPHTLSQPLNPRWECFPWPETDEHLWESWIKGNTGIPLVDAGMRELWQTGWMHNRVRMNAASLLVKNMLIPWWRGERWFFDTLVDADIANNVLGWQWVAGCGADAAPYFRIFNPVLQGERFDSDGRYVRRWVPELAALPDRWLHRPWAAPREVLGAAGVTLGVHYPYPVVDLARSRDRALLAAKTINKTNRQ